MSDKAGQLNSDYSRVSGKDADQLPSWLYLWMPIAVMVVVWTVGKVDHDFYQRYIGTESGLLEFSHIVLPLMSAVICVMLLRMPESRSDNLVFAWIVMALVGSIYLAGEEASWGQHMIGWITPDYWQTLNDQGETNLHNTSSWMDQKPRTLLEFGIIIGGIIIPLMALRKTEIRTGRFAIFLPPLICLPIAILVEFSRIWERLYKLKVIDFDVFVRDSELQEFYFYLFIFVYLLVFRKRLAALKPAA